jgi:FkbM family methyltransferase
VNLERIRQNVIIDGRPALTAFRAVCWAGHCAIQRPATVRIGDHGPLMTVQPRLHSVGSTSLYMKRDSYEPSLRIFTSFIRPGDVVLDIGANYGVYALLTASAARPNGMVHCFEPGTASLAQLKRNLALNPDLPIAVHEVALSDTTGDARLYHVGGSPTTFSLGHESRAGDESVKKTTLDAWAESVRVPKVSAIKMDVEGHEPYVIRGGSRLVATHKPMIMFEISPAALRRNGSTEDELWTLMTGLGYIIYGLQNGRLTPARGPSHGNHFALPTNFVQPGDVQASPVAGR